MIYLFTLLMFLDVLLTIVILNRGGRELNPLLVGIGADKSLEVLVVVKVAVTVVIWQFVAGPILDVLCFGMACLVAWNFYQWRKQK